MPFIFLKAIPASLGQVALNFVLIDFSDQESFAAVLALNFTLADLQVVMEFALGKYFLAASAAGRCVAVSFMVVKICQWVWVLTEPTSTRLRAVGLMFIDFILRELDFTSSASRFVRTICLVLFNNPQRENIEANFTSSRFRADGFVLFNDRFWIFKSAISTSDTILAMSFMAFQLE